MAAIVTGVFLLLVTVISIALPRLLAQGRDIAAVKDQVQNSHKTNLRDDLDALRIEIRHEFTQVHDRLGRLEDKDG
jgi:hypothetical protein